MEYTSLGRSGLIVSRIGLGTYTFGSGPNRTQAQSVTEQSLANEIVDRSIDAGINLFNTSDAYSGSHQMLRAALGERRSDVIISAKTGLRLPRGRFGELSALREGGLSRRSILAALDRTLRELGTDYVDIYIAHVPDEFTQVEETVDAFEYALRSGRIRYYGLSNWPAWMAATALEIGKRGGVGPSTVEMYYSLAAREVEAEYEPFIAYSGMGFMAWSPLSGGLLSGKYTTESGDGRLRGFSLTPVREDVAHRVIAELKAVGDERGASAAQMALAWLLRTRLVDSILIGATSLLQLEENLAAVRVEMNDEIFDRLSCANAVEEKYPYSVLSRVRQTWLRGFADYRRKGG